MIDHSSHPPSHPEYLFSDGIPLGNDSKTDLSDLLRAIAIENARLYEASQAAKTDHQRLEESLRQANASLEQQKIFNRALLAAIPTPVYIKDSQGRYLSGNNAFLKQMGVAEKEILGKTDFELTGNHRIGQNLILTEESIYDGAGHLTGLVGSYVDITERKRAEKVQDALYRISEATQTAEDLGALYRQIHGIIGELMSATNFYIALYDATADLLSFPYYMDEYDIAAPPQKPGRGLTEYVIRSGQPLLATPEVFEQLLVESQVESIGASSIDWLGVPLKAQKKVIGMMAVQTYTPQVRYTQADLDVLMFVSTQVALAIERKRVEGEIKKLNQDLQHHANELAIINQAGQVMTSTLDLEELLSQVVEQTRSLLDAEAAFVVLCDPSLEDESVPGTTFTEIFYADETGSGSGRMQGVRLSPKTGIAGWVIREKQAALIKDIQTDPRFPRDPLDDRATTNRSLLAVPLIHRGRILGVVEAINQKGRFFTEHDQAALEVFCSSAAIALENARLLAETKRRAEQLTLLYEAGLTLNGTLDSHEQLKSLSKIALQALHANHSCFFRYNAETNQVEYEFGFGREINQDLIAELRFPVGEERGLIGLVAQKREPFYLPDVSVDPRWIVTDPEICSALWVPVERENQLLGLLSVASTEVNAFSTDDVQLLVLLANQVAVSMENARLYESAVNATERHTTLHWLSQEIISARSEPERVYQAIYQATSKMMPAEAFVIGLLDGAVNEIEIPFSIDRDQRYPARRLDRNQGISGQIISSGKPLIIHDLQNSKNGQELVHFGGPSQVRSIVAVPMRMAGQVMGVLSSQSYRPNAYSIEDSKLLEILASYTAIALENARMVADMQAAHTELVNAYEATIAGWSRALEMRDKETQGHADRVTRITLSLAREIGIPEEEMVHLRRGVLLHDIGKMAIPDHILLKPGPLDEDEWMIIRQHPSYAYQMLSGIPFLNGAIDIPYGHHEKWNGTGYPRGLKGSEIPLGARIFALADVWDALTSSRPYHPAWLPEAARAYIASQSGIQFDPQLVAAFLKLLDEGKFK